MKKFSFLENTDWLYTPAFKDLVTICVVAIETIVMTEVLQLAREMTQPPQDQRVWLIEKIVTVPVILSLALAFYASRRWKELCVEVAEHKKTENILKKRTLEMRKAKTIAEDATKAKSDFLANISHELRTPLHSILSFANFGIKKNGDAEAGKILDYFNKIHQSGETLLQLVDDLLDLSKFKSGKVEMDFQWTDLKKLIGVVVDEFRSIAAEKNISILCRSCDFDDKIEIDIEKIKRVLRNLLSNAVKFSQGCGTIEIVICQSPESVSVSVRDSGIGISDDELETIFGKFVQSAKTKTVAGGTGLGLTICRQIMDAHKGCIWAENNTDKGATFIFELPLSVSAEPPQRQLVNAG